MLVLFSSEPKVLLKLRASLPAGQLSAVAKSWTEFESKAPAAECSTVVIEWLNRDPTFSLLCAFREHHPQHPLALVTRWDPESARHLKEVFVEEVVWFREVERELPPVIERLCKHDFNFVRCMAVPFEQAERLPATLRRALAYACRAERPVGSIKQLAGMKLQEVAGNQEEIVHLFRERVLGFVLREEPLDILGAG